MRARSNRKAAEQRARVRMLKAKYGPDPEAILCEGCGRSVAHDPHEPLSRARGGSVTDPDNVEALCRTCHQGKHATNDLRHSWTDRPPNVSTSP